MKYRIITALLLVVVLGGLYITGQDDGSPRGANRDTVNPPAGLSDDEKALKGFKIP